MTTDTSNPLPPKFAESIAAAVDATKSAKVALPKAEQDKQFVKDLRGVGFHLGHDGVAAYKEHNTGAKNVRVNISVLAYVPKPRGYDDYLVSMVEGWLTNEAALASTNVADVIRLNARFETLYDPAKHFSQPVSKGRLAKIKAVFAKHHAPLDITKVNTMSKVREAAKSVRTRVNADRPFGKVGFIAGDTLTINERSFQIEWNGQRECIRVLIDGKRSRLYLNELEWMADLLDNQHDVLSSTTLRSIGERAYSAEMTKNSPTGEREISGLAYGRSPLSDRIAALRSVDDPVSEELPEGVDPLTL
jgi:hypothetical protein